MSSRKLNALHIACFLWVLSCTSEPAPTPTTPAYEITDHHVISGLYLIRDNLYRDEVGELYFRVVDVEYADRGRQIIYIKRTGAYGQDEIRGQSLKELIDADTWKQEYDTIYSDKDNLYCHHYYTGGGWIKRVDNFDPKDLKVLISEEGVDRLIIDIENFDQATLTDRQRAWHFTDGDKVIDYKCQEQGLLDGWAFE